MAKGPIYFRSRVRKHVRPNRSGPRRQGGEIDEWLDYWRERVRRPFAVGGRTFWTERMLYGNALAGGIILAIIEAWRLGFSIWGVASAVLNALFLVFIWYYAIPWLTQSIHSALTQSRRPPDTAGVKSELIAFSGLFTLVPLMSIISFGLAFWIGWAVVAVTLWRIVRFYHEESVPVSALESLAGSLLMALVAVFFFR